MKWLPDHIQYAYKIWTQSDQWFLRYKRKWDLTFDLHLHNQDGRISTWIVSMLDNGRKLMCIEFGQFMMNAYADMNDEVKSQNGA